MIETSAWRRLQSSVANKSSAAAKRQPLRGGDLRPAASDRVASIRCPFPCYQKFSGPKKGLTATIPSVRRPADRRPLRAHRHHHRRRRRPTRRSKKAHPSIAQPPALIVVRPCSIIDTRVPPTACGRFLLLVPLATSAGRRLNDPLHRRPKRLLGRIVVSFFRRREFSLALSLTLSVVV